MFSVIICSIDEAKFKAVTEMFSRALRGSVFEILGVHEASSLAQGYNHGIAASKGDYLILCHDDVEIACDELAARLERRFEQYDLLGVAGARRLVDARWLAAGPPHIFGQVIHATAGQPGYTLDIYGVPRRTIGGIHAMDGVFLACKRKVAETVHFDEQIFDGFHCYDVDFTFAAHLAGFKLAVCADIPLIHHSGGNYDQRWDAYAQRFRAKYAGRLDAGPVPSFHWTAIAIATKEEALARANPDYWDEP